MTINVIIEKYSSNKKTLWDNFVRDAKNSYFLFYRDYMEYHSDKFLDQSLMIYEDKELIALLPANIENNILYSHKGLTFGGFIINNKMKTPKMLSIFSSLLSYMKEQGISKLLYKASPHIFHKIPSEEDIYSLFYYNAKLIRRDVSSAILLENKLKFERGRIRCIEKAKRNNLTIKLSDDYEAFFNIVENLLNRKYGVKPVHNYDEMKLLHSRFPENIKLFACFKRDKMLGGALIYESDIVAHAQYIFSSDEGKELGANDVVYDHIIETYKNKRYFNIGISTEKNGKYLNEQLINQKEMWGARAICFDWYELMV